jgi:hypothetical protein
MSAVESSNDANVADSVRRRRSGAAALRGVIERIREAGSHSGPTFDGEQSICASSRWNSSATPHKCSASSTFRSRRPSPHEVLVSEVSPLNTRPTGCHRQAGATTPAPHTRCGGGRPRARHRHSMNFKLAIWSCYPCMPVRGVSGSSCRRCASSDRRRASGVGSRSRRWSGGGPAARIAIRR